VHSIVHQWRRVCFRLESQPSSCRSDQSARLLLGPRENAPTNERTSR